MLKIAIIIGSTRQGRRGESVGRWLLDVATARADADYHLIDLMDFNLPFIGDASAQPNPAWAATIGSFDGFVLVTPEYNRAPNAALKNALDLVGPEWQDKAVAFASYGGFGGLRAVESLRLVTANLQMAGIKAQVALTLGADFTDDQLTPRPHQPAAAEEMLTQLVAWSGVLRTLRTNYASSVAA